MLKIRKKVNIVENFHIIPLVARGAGSSKANLLKGSLDILKDNRKLMGPAPNLPLGLLDLFITGFLLFPWLLVGLVNITVVYIKQVGIEGNCNQNIYDVLNIQWCMPFGPLKKF